ncbi:fumarylacetoacetate hydrolase family protein [bacterium]|nr:MAG: fumarylacetoacetate hydrolase family protein [bacterium]
MKGLEVEMAPFSLPSIPSILNPMKLIRFEMLSEPGVTRTGVAHAGRIYETEAGEPKGMHAAAEIRPLLPVVRPGAFRLFPNGLQSVLAYEEAEYVYGNPNALIGPGQVVPYPPTTSSLGFEAWIACVLHSDGHRVPVELADDLILGITILNVLVARDGSPYGRSRDIGCALGPVLTTPDELDGFVTDESNGRRYGLNAFARINGVERASGESESLPLTFAQAIAAASQNYPVREGDVFALGPLIEPTEIPLLDPDDEATVSIEGLGAISMKIMSEGAQE